MAEETKIIRIIVDSSKAVDGSASATRALERMERSTASMDTALARMERSLGTVGLYLKTNLILLATDMASRLFQMGKSALAAAGDMGELAQQMGITVKGLQGLQFAGIQNRISLEQLETGVGKFTQKIGEAAGGSKEMIDSLNDMGVKILDVNGKILPTEKLMQGAAVAILAMSDPAKQAAVNFGLNSDIAAHRFFQGIAHAGKLLVRQFVRRDNLGGGFAAACCNLVKKSADDIGQREQAAVARKNAKEAPGRIV